ncbi:MAG: SDR family oxidoreductase [Chloroflexota bacterium]|nr:SDR family oxidoreductase [Chloroflexota bacterium]
MALPVKRAVVAGDGPIAAAIAERLESAGSALVRSAPGEPLPGCLDRAAAGGPLGVAVVCTRGSRSGSMDQLREEDWEAVVGDVLVNTALACRAALPAMRANGSGRLILVGDRACLGSAGDAAFAAAEAGVVSLARSLALEAGKDGVTVNTVVPGTIDVGQMAALPEDRRERLRKLQPGGRFGTPADVAEAVLFFASEESVYITGQTLFVCGGTSLYSSLSV